MKTLKIIGTLIIGFVLIGQRFMELPDVVLGLGYGAYIGIVILGLIPKDKYEKIKAFKKSVLTR